MFGRDAEPNGLEYWTGVLSSGEKSLAEIATTILNAAGGQDRQVVDAKVAAAAEYTAEFGAAEDYNLEAATAVVVGADGGIFVPELTEAIETLLAEEQALAEFLESEAVDFDEDPEIETSAQDVRDNLTSAESALAADITNNGGSTNQLNANLQDAQAQLATAQQNIAAVPNLRKEIADYQAAQDATEAAEAALLEANVDLNSESSAFETRNGGATLSVNPDGTASYDTGSAFIVLNAENELEIVQSEVDAQGLEGVEALLTDIEAKLAAEADLSNAQLAEDEALTAVENLENGENDTPLLDALVSAQTAVDQAETAIENRSELETDVTEAQALVDQLVELENNIDDAEQAIADLDVDLNGADDVSSTEDDLYIFDAETGLTTGNVDEFSFEGEDLFFIGDAFTRVDLNENDDVLADSSFGESGTLEVFFQQVGANTVLSFESEAFQGNATNGFQGDVITITGVNAEDLQLENGYISIA